MTVLSLLDAGASGAGTVRFRAESRERSIAEVWRSAAGVARWIDANVEDGAPVAALLGESSAAVVTALGVLRSGRSLVSLQLPPRGATTEDYLRQLAACCATTGAGVVFLDADRIGLADGIGIPAEPFTDDRDAPGTCRDEMAELVQFSSGSTGAPKGIRLSPEAVAYNIRAILDAWSVVPGDVVCSWLPLSHDMGLVAGLLSTIVGNGAEWGGDRSLFAMSPLEFVADPRSWLKACSDSGASFTIAPNFGFDLATARPPTEAIDLSRLRYVGCGSETVRPASMRLFADTYRPHGLRADALSPCYGLAEAVVGVTTVRPSEHWSSMLVDLDEGSHGQRREVVALGSPLPGMRVRVNDGGEGSGVGSVQVAGSLLSGYVGDAPLELIDGTWFDTGDLGFVHDGELYFLGRVDDRMKVRGRVMYAQEVENHLVGHPSVRPGNVVIVPTDRGGYAVVAEPHRNLVSGDVPGARTQIRSLLVRQVGVAPQDVVFVAPGTIPKTASGKVRRRILAAQLERGELQPTP